MYITRQNRQLVKIAGSINLLFLLLSIAFIFFLGYEHSVYQRVIGKAITFTLANSACWIVNLFILMVFVPLLSKWKNARSGLESLTGLDRAGTALSFQGWSTADALWPSSQIVVAPYRAWKRAVSRYSGLKITGSFC